MAVVQLLVASKPSGTAGMIMNLVVATNLRFIGVMALQRAASLLLFVVRRRRESECDVDVLIAGSFFILS